jgi:hexosaminidase
MVPGATDPAGNILSDETYALSLNSESGTLSANTIWGIFRGLETVMQSIHFIYCDGVDPAPIDPGTTPPSPRGRWGWYLLDLPIVINDEPRFGHRGLLLDTSRHWMPVSTIKQVIDSMAMTKLNVLHWHATDADSIPFNIPGFPALATHAVFDRELVYGVDDIRDIVEYARSRGIRVIPEIEGVGHAAAVGRAYPNVTADCVKWASEPPMSSRENTFEWPQPNIIGYKVTDPAAIEFAASLLGALLQYFPDPFAHVGGDEVRMDCFEHAPSMVAWMQMPGQECPSPDLSHSIPCATYNATLGTWRYEWDGLVNRAQRTFAHVAIAMGKTPIAWQEAFTNGAIGKEGVAMAYYGNSLDVPGTLASELSPNYLTAKGLRVINVVAGGLDRTNPICANRVSPPGCPTPALHFETATHAIYRSDPVTSFLPAPVNAWQANLIIGAQLSMWSETVDLNNWQLTLWPRGLAGAERFWSPGWKVDYADWLRRADPFACLMNVNRGIRASAVRPSYCRFLPSNTTGTHARVRRGVGGRPGRSPGRRGGRGRRAEGWRRAEGGGVGRARRECEVRAPSTGLLGDRGTA